MVGGKRSLAMVGLWVLLGAVVSSAMPAQGQLGPAVATVAQAVGTVEQQVGAVEDGGKLSTPPTSVSLGSEHRCILHEDGSVECAEIDPCSLACEPGPAYGVTLDHRSPPALAVSARGPHACLLFDSGDVQCWTPNGVGAGYSGGDAVAVVTGGSQSHEGYTCVLRDNGTVHCYEVHDPVEGSAYASPVLGDYPGGDAVAIDAYRENLCILRDTGNVDCHGADAWGLLGGYSGGDAVAVAMGNRVACVLTTSGNVSCWGVPWYQQQMTYAGGDGIGLAVGSAHTCVLQASGNVDCSGPSYASYAADHSHGDALAVFAGESVTCVLRPWAGLAERTYLDCQGNTSGAGDYPDYQRNPSDEEVTVPEVPDVVAFVEGWVASLEGTVHQQEQAVADLQAELGNGGIDCMSICIPAGFVEAVAVAGGAGQTCALLVTGNVDCWGHTSYRDSEFPEDDWAIDDYTGEDAVAVDVGYDLMCLVTAAGNVDCQGWDGWGAGKEPYTGGQAVDVSVSESASCILLSTGNVDCRGKPDYSGGDAMAVSAGAGHVCVATAAGNIDCWGSSGAEAADYLGGDAIGVAAGASHTCALLDSGNVDCWGGFEYCVHGCWGPAHDYLGGDAVAVSVGYYHSCFLLADGNVDCDGGDWMHEEESDSEGVGQANDDTNGDAVAIGVGDHHSCLVTGSGAVRCWGDGSWGKTTGSPGSPPISGLPSPFDTPTCAPNTSSSLKGADKDGDGINGQYVRKHTVYTVHEDGTVSSENRNGDCWMGLDPDDDGQERVPDPGLAVPPGTLDETSFCAPNANSAPKGLDKDGDGINGQYVRKYTLYTLHEDGTVTSENRNGDCWIGLDPDDDGVQRVPA